jgi:hypothetical protein
MSATVANKEPWGLPGRKLTPDPLSADSPGTLQKI